MKTTDKVGGSLFELLRLSPLLKKGKIGGFALDYLGKIPPTFLCKRGDIIYGQVLRRLARSPRRRLEPSFRPGHYPP